MEQRPPSSYIQKIIVQPNQTTSNTSIQIPPAFRNFVINSPNNAGLSFATQGQSPVRATATGAQFIRAHMVKTSKPVVAPSQRGISITMQPTSGVRAQVINASVPNSNRIVKIMPIAPQSNSGPSGMSVSGMISAVSPSPTPNDVQVQPTSPTPNSKPPSKRARLVSPMSFPKKLDLTEVPVITAEASSTAPTIPVHLQPTKIQYTSASKQLFESLGGKKRVCNCSKSMCLKLYCECFANGEFCFSCNCTNCCNTLENEFERQQAVRSCLERNPHAFHPKVGKASFSEERSHYKGCNCKRSNCLKNYCECYEAKILCSSVCKCVGCRNNEESSGRRHYGDISALRALRVGTMRDLSTFRSEYADKLPFTLMTQEVIEATVQCLLAQAEEAQMSQRSQPETESALLHEFGQCLNKIIASAHTFKTQLSSPGT